MLSCSTPRIITLNSYMETSKVTQQPNGKSVYQQARRWLVYGQPVHETHPELLGKGELAPGINSEEFAKRRKKLASLLPSRSVAILTSASPVSISGIRSPYQQDPNFLYLTGLIQEGVALIRCSKDNEEPEFVVFVPQADEGKDKWDGQTFDCEAAKYTFGASEAFPLAQMAEKLQDMTKDSLSLFMTSSSTDNIQQMGLSARVRSILKSKGVPLPLESYIQSLRLIKSPAEVRLMRRSAQIASRAMRRCIELTESGVAEHALAAHFEYDCKLRGAQRLAYPPIVASGVDCCTIHYSRNDKVVGIGDLILMDAGCSLFGYLSDVTRTWPASGCFSGAQRDLYEAVHSVHARMLEECRPSSSIKELHMLSVSLLSDALKQLGIVSMSSPRLAAGAYRDFYPHMIGHFLGLDVHDTSTVLRSAELVPGIILALEPGLYIPNDAKYGHFRGLGIRIEDDVLVTEMGAVVLSSEVPSEREKIESLVQSTPHGQELFSTYGN